MDGSLAPFLILVGVFGLFWLFGYCYLLYRVGRALAARYRTRPTRTFVLIALASGSLSAACCFLPIDMLGKAALVFAVWITHTQAVGWGFWAGMELGRSKDNTVFAQRTEEWLREWEQPVQKRQDSSD